MLYRAIQIESNTGYNHTVYFLYISSASILHGSALGLEASCLFLLSSLLYVDWFSYHTSFIGAIRSFFSYYALDTHQCAIIWHHRAVVSDTILLMSIVS